MTTFVEKRFAATDFQLGKYSAVFIWWTNQMAQVLRRLLLVREVRG